MHEKNINRANNFISWAQLNSSRVNSTTPRVADMRTKTTSCKQERLLCTQSYSFTLSWVNCLEAEPKEGWVPDLIVYFDGHFRLLY